MSTSKSSGKHHGPKHRATATHDADLGDASTTATTTESTVSTYDDLDPDVARTQTSTATSSGVSKDGYMIRAEERLVVGKQEVDAGKAQLNKFVTSEHQYASVPVVKEHAVLHTEPITEADHIAVDRIAPAHFEMQLSEEHAVAGKKAVAVEKVALKKELEHTTEIVGAELQKEHIEYRSADESDKGRIVSNYATTKKEYE